MIFGKKIPPGDVHLIQHRWKKLAQIEDLYKRLYEGFNLYQYAILKLGSKPKFKNQTELDQAIQLLEKIEKDIDFTLSTEICNDAINEFEKALIQLKVLGKSKTKS